MSVLFSVVSLLRILLRPNYVFFILGVTGFTKPLCGSARTVERSSSATPKNGKYETKYCYINVFSFFLVMKCVHSIVQHFID